MRSLYYRFLNNRSHSVFGKVTKGMERQSRPIKEREREKGKTLNEKRDDARGETGARKDSL